LTDALSSSHASLGILQQQLQGSMEKSSLKLSEISEELLEQIDARISEIPDPTAQLDQVLQLRMNELVTVLKTELSASIDAKLRSYDAVKTKQLKAGLEQFGIQLNETSDAIEGELMANAAEGVDPIQQAMMGLATWQPPKKWANDNPLPAMLIQSGKVQALQQIQQMIPTKTGLNKAVGISDKSGIFG